MYEVTFTDRQVAFYSIFRGGGITRHASRALDIISVEGPMVIINAERPSYDDIEFMHLSYIFSFAHRL